MQAFETPTLAAFGIKLNPQAFQSEKLALAPENIATIETALRENLIERHGATPVQDLSPNGRIAVTIQTATALMRARKYVEVAHLAAVADPLDRLIRVKALSLQMLRSFDDLTREVDEQEAKADLPEETRAFLFTLRLKNVKSEMRIKVEDHGVFMADIPDSLEEALSNLSGPARVAVPPPQMEALVSGLIHTRGNPEDTPDDLLRRLLWGQNVDIYIKFLRRFSLPFLNCMPDDPTARKLLRLNHELGGALILDDASPLQAAAATQSVLLSTAHAGASEVEWQLFGHVDLPMALVAANSDTTLRGTNRLTLGTQGDFQANFLKLVKIVKKSPHLIRIFPDGPKGGDLLEFDLLGRKIRLGQGAATLAWHARAATFFTGTRWEGAKIRIYLRQGPVADKGMGREAFDQAFYAFYLDCLKEIVLGAPEDMGGMGGFWPSLITEQP